MTPPPPRSTLFPYTTLFRSHRAEDLLLPRARRLCDVPRRRRLLSRLRSEEHTSELQSRRDLVCRLLLEKKKQNNQKRTARRASSYLTQACAGTCYSNSYSLY